MLEERAQLKCAFANEQWRKSGSARVYLVKPKQDYMQFPVAATSMQ